MITEKIIHIDGLDKTGKDTIKDNLVKLSEGKYLILARSFISQIVYSKIYKRNINIDFFIDKMKKAFDNNEYFIFLDCDEFELIKRFKKHDEKDLDIKDINKHKEIFYNTVKLLKQKNINIYIIDTTYKTPNECCIEIINYIQKGE